MERPPLKLLKFPPRTEVQSADRLTPKDDLAVALVFAKKYVRLRRRKPYCAEFVEQMIDNMLQELDGAA